MSLSKTNNGFFFKYFFYINALLFFGVFLHGRVTLTAMKLRLTLSNKKENKTKVICADLLDFDCD